MAGRRRPPQRATKRTSALSAENERLKRELEMLAVRSPVPVEIERAPAERLPEQVEAAIYYVVAEALTNVAKYSRARVASVRVFREDAYVVAEVEDDGVGGADAKGGPTLLRAIVRSAAS
jgi:signal transduction histidine kinase